MLLQALCIISEPLSYSPEMPNLGQNRRFFVPCDLENWPMIWTNNRAPLLCYSPETPNSGQNRRFLVLCDLEICWMTLKNNRAPLLCYFKHCASFQNHQWVQTWVTVRKRPIRVNIGDFWSHVTLKFDGWPWKTIGHLFYATSSFVHHFTTIGEFKLELQSGNAQIGVKKFLKFWPLWPWPFAWTSLLSMVITPENFMMIQGGKHNEKDVTGRRTDRQNDKEMFLKLLGRS